MGVVLAANGLGAARVAGADADDGDRRAVEADEDVDALDDDAEQAEEERRSGAAGLWTGASAGRSEHADRREHEPTGRSCSTANPQSSTS